MAQRVPIKFTPQSSKGDHVQTGGGRLVNAIVEQIEDGRTIVKRAPGLSRFAQSVDSNSHCRGMIAANSATLLILYDDEVESITLSGGSYVSEVRGALSGSDLVTLARNNATTPDVVGVSPDGGAFTLAAAGAPGAYPDADVGSPISVCFTGGYFFFAYGDGRCRASGLNSTAINSSDEVKAESGAGGLLRNVAYRGQLFLCGPSGIEVWQGDQPNASGFPFNRATVIPRGIAGTNAIAGWEDGFASALCWAGADNMVYQLRGYEPYRISTPTIERDLQALTDKTTLRCFVAAHNGHPYFYLKAPAFTHAFDLLTSTWQERKSYGYERFRAEQSVHMFGDWILGDEFSGDLLRLDADNYFESDQPLVFDVESDTTDDFPLNAAVNRADFNFVGGSGEGGGDDPQVMVSWSNSGGRDFGMPLMRSLGAIGDYSNLVTVKRCGRMGAHGRKWRLQVSDPGYVGLLGGTMYLER
jgi:hypothetical protein